MHSPEEQASEKEGCGCSQENEERDVSALLGRSRTFHVSKQAGEVVMNRSMHITSYTCLPPACLHGFAVADLAVRAQASWLRMTAL